MRLRFGRGYIGVGKYKSKHGGKPTKEHQIWTEMFKRCYCTIYKSKFSTYDGCSVKEDWFNFQKFADWCNSQKGFGMENFELDKDLLLSGNKTYSADTCCFLPKSINYSLVSVRTKNTKNGLPIGVSKLRNGTYQAHINKNGKNFTLGTCKTVEDAWQIYKKAKESRLKDLAELWADHIEPKAYSALIDYEVKMYG